MRTSSIFVYAAALCVLGGLLEAYSFASGRYCNGPISGCIQQGCSQAQGLCTNPDGQIVTYQAVQTKSQPYYACASQVG